MLYPLGALLLPCSSPSLIQHRPECGWKSWEFPVGHKNLYTELWDTCSHSQCPGGHFQRGGSFQRNPCHSLSLQNVGTYEEWQKMSWRFPEIHGLSPAFLRDLWWLCRGIWWPKGSRRFTWEWLLPSPFPTEFGNPEGLSGNVPSSFFTGYAELQHVGRDLSWPQENALLDNHTWNQEGLEWLKAN